jgi:hypothetical protein
MPGFRAKGDTGKAGTKARRALKARIRSISHQTPRQIFGNLQSLMQLQQSYKGQCDRWKQPAFNGAPGRAALAGHNSAPGWPARAGAKPDEKRTTCPFFGPKLVWLLPQQRGARPCKNVRSIDDFFPTASNPLLRENSPRVK